ncbi:MAG TPA: glycosyltransferase family 2 protein [Gemmatimonadaceae bacterium]|nr:glycosyltransferase family 2 protein [Gemmatimonadaceae bacterium]
MRPEHPFLSIVVPVHQGGAVLPRCLAAIAASDLPRAAWELIVVDDASTDDTAVIAAEYADTVVRLPRRPHGPAYARNRGFEVSRGECVVFVDADVCVHGDTLSQFARVFAEEPDVSAVFGSYDERPADPGIVSQYRNLLHHHVHQQGEGEAETFWAGCGAVRSEVFAAAGMYDEWRFPRPQIEDIDLGYRIRSLGYRIVLRPEIQGTHLKRWTFRGMVATDLNSRGVPWMRLLLQEGATLRAGTLNLRASEKVNALLVGLAVALAVTSLARREPRWLVAALLCLLPVVVTNWRLFTLFVRRHGVLFALAAFPLHLVYYLVSGTSAVLGWLIHEVMGEPTPEPAVSAFSEVGVRMWPPVPTDRKAQPRTAPGDER